MNLQDCWTNFLTAEQLLEDGHWSAAHQVFEKVLQHLPQHIQTALHDEETRPCQFACLLRGLKDATTSQSEILNHMGEHHAAFDLLNQSYALLQFIALEPNVLVKHSTQTLEKHSDDLLKHMTAFCAAHHDSHWAGELQKVEESHHHFRNLTQHRFVSAQSAALN